MAPRFPIPGVDYRAEAERDRFLATGDWLNLTAGEALRQAAADCPDKRAVIGHDGTLTFSELDARTEQLAAGLLAAGLRPGDRAVFQVGAVKEFFVALFACYKAGIIPVCTLAQYRELEIGPLAERSGAVAFFVQADVHPSFDQVAFARRMREAVPALKHLVVLRGGAVLDYGPDEYDMEALADAVAPGGARALVAPFDPNPEDVVALQMSGGSTSLPKIIPRMHGEYLGATRALARRYELTDRDTSLWTLPLIHNAGMLFVVLPMALERRTVVSLHRFEIREFLEAIGKHKATFSGSIGPVAPRMLEFGDIKDYDLSTLKQFFCLSRADALEPHVGIICGNMFGITEGLVMASAPSDPAAMRHGSVGRPVAGGDEIRLLRPGTENEVGPDEVGELCFRGPSTLTCYFADPATTAASFTSDRFFRSGDLVRAMPVEGRTCYVFEGRIKDNINRGGEKIGAEEVEVVVSAHPAVADVRVVAMPDKFYGEKVCAYVIPRPGHTVPSVKELGQFMLGRGLAKYKLPERIEVVDVFPVTSVGKVDKARLRALIAEQIQREETAGA
jgi:non-ribosomal peptide synthetase component E (peptide arylation enzyme)